MSIHQLILNPKMAGGERGQFDPPPCGFSQNMFLIDRKEGRESENLIINIAICHVFSENFTEIPHIIQKIWRSSPSILTNFSVFFTFF